MSITKETSPRSNAEPEKGVILSAVTPGGHMSKPRIVGEQIWCPVCNEYTQFIKIANAAKLASVHRRTIYRYVEEGIVSAVRVAGKSYRICSTCLIRQVG